MNGKHEWWQTGIIYQIYPRSYQDANGDGVGDLAGILSRLDYLTWLGVDAVWLSPIYPSPMKDFGYDVSDYCDVHPLFGNLADFDRLVAEAHRRNLRVVLDFVPNHTSDKHPWFLESCTSRTNPKRDWYIWRDPAPNGGPPNNWLSNFGGSAWQFDETTRQYYYHAFLTEQPDLNWRNPELRRAMHDVLRFWMDRGVDGFRVDVIWHIAKDDEFRDNPLNPNYKPGQNPHHQVISTYEADQPHIHDIIGEMRRVLDAYPERMMVGEIYLPVEKLVTYYGEGGTGVHMPFNFQLITTPWDARTIAAAVQRYEASLPEYGWPNWVLGNHDNPRIASRIGHPQARAAAMLLLTLRGTPTLYYGDEIGMADVPIPLDAVQDPFEKNVPGMGLGRDPERTPMQWDASPNAGFAPANVHPWLPLAPDFQTVNVETRRQDERSLLSLYRKLIALRRSTPALTIGAYEPLSMEGSDTLLGYIRHHDGSRFLVVLNLGPEPTPFGLTTGHVSGHIALSTHLDRSGEPVDGLFKLRGDEGVIIQLAP
jgi:alpha-glucosidase